jgi:hypothetical protein
VEVCCENREEGNILPSTLATPNAKVEFLLQFGVNRTNRRQIVSLSSTISGGVVVGLHMTLEDGNLMNGFVTTATQKKRRKTKSQRVWWFSPYFLFLFLLPT